MSYDDTREAVLLFGGVNFWGNRINEYGDLWSWDGTNWTLIGNTGYSPAGHRMVYDSKLKVTVVFGPKNNAPQAATLQYFGDKAWIPMGSLEPFASVDAGFGYDASRDRLVVVGKTRSPGRWVTQTEEWDGIRFVPFKGETPTPAAMWSTLAHDPGRERMVMFACNRDDNTYGTWEFDGRKWLQATGPGPGLRTYASMVYDDKLKCVLLYGGMKPDFTWNSDLWSWDGKNWKRLSADGPAIEMAIAYDKKRDRVVLVGDDTHSEALGTMQTWEWDGAKWTRKP